MLHLNNGYLRPAEEAYGHVPGAYAGVNVEGTGLCLEEASVVFSYVGWQNGCAEKREADLAAV